MLIRFDFFKKMFELNKMSNFFNVINDLKSRFPQMTEIMH